MIQFIMSVVLVLVTTALASAQSGCDNLFYGGQEPVIVNQKLGAKYRTLCNREYSVGHSGLTRTPLWAAGVLTREGLSGKGHVPRSNQFAPDMRLPSGERSELSDYARSGYDRGHIFAASEAVTQAGSDGTFLLSNMVPQAAAANRGIHEAIESLFKHLAKKRGRLYTVTGPIFQGEKLQALKGRVIVPSAVYKCFLDDNRQEAACYIDDNAPGGNYRMATVGEVESLTGLNLYPAAPDNVKRVMAVVSDAPRMRSRR